ncbi:Gfo/Idh/MocA family protein [Microbacterium sp. NPDC058342]|uniref:Gfo/Idh/MocA family protein n=1 Tax=Microbacterium sp. NPDC058342 TaxID=3346454 RepID=UPI003656DEF0
MKIAVLSLAHPHAQSYIAALQRMPDIELAVSDPGHATRPVGESGGPALARELGGTHYLASYDEIWRWGPDAVIVCAENIEHRALAERAAAEGVHILCEKPLATTPEDASAMVAAADAAGVVLMVAYPVRFSPAYEELRESVRKGSLGEIVAISATNCGGVPVGTRSWFIDPALSGGGALTDHVVHAADLIGDLLGEEPVEVYATTTAIPNGGSRAVETGGLVSLRYEGGVIASIDCSWSRTNGAPDVGDLVTLSVVGTEGFAEIAPFADILTGWSARRGSLAHSYVPPMDDLLLREFLLAVREGVARQPDGRTGRAHVELVAGAYESTRLGTPIPLRPALH